MLINDDDILLHTYDAERVRRLQLKFIVFLLREGFGGWIRIREQWRVIEEHIRIWRKVRRLANEPVVIIFVPLLRFAHVVIHVRS